MRRLDGFELAFALLYPASLQRERTIGLTLLEFGQHTTVKIDSSEAPGGSEHSGYTLEAKARNAEVSVYALLCSPLCVPPR